MKFREMRTTPGTMGAITRYISERLFNLNKLYKQNGNVPKSDLLLGDIVITEAKLDALIMLLEDQGFDFSKFDMYLADASRVGQANAISIRKQFEEMNAEKK